MRCEGRRPGGKQARTSDRESWRGALGNASLTLALRRSVPRGGNEAGAALGAGGTAADVRAACAGNRTCAGVRGHPEEAGGRKGRFTVTTECRRGDGNIVKVSVRPAIVMMLVIKKIWEHSFFFFFFFW